MVHAPLEQREFDTLELAAQWAAELAKELATTRAQQAGAAQIEVSIDRKDNIVEQQGQSTFFESTIVATASGRAGGKT
jgi:transcriptional antiterminator Rof (Rho-off)